MKATKQFVVRPDHRIAPWLRRWIVTDPTGRVLPPDQGPDNYLTEREARHRVTYLEQTQEVAA